MASTSKPDEHGPYSSTDDEGVNTHRAKRRKGPKACDVCRRKKIRCDPDPSGEAQKPCVNCAVFKTECTFTYVAKKRRTQQAYIDSLQNRLGKLERLLMKLAPDIDISKELDDSTSTLQTLSRSRNGSSPRAPSPPKPVPRPPPDPRCKPSEIVAAFTTWRDTNNDSTNLEDESEDEFMSFIPLGPPESDPGTPGTGGGTKSHKFLGNSSGLTFLQKVIGMKRESTGGAESPVNNDQFVMHPDPWETHVNYTPPPMFTFPSPSLITHLVSVYFRCVNTFLPLLHRPSFEQALSEGRHQKEPGWGAVLLLVCAVASRWSEDERVLPIMEANGKRCENKAWSSAGWEFYWQVHQRYRRNLMDTTTVLDLQMMALAAMYLQGTSNSSPSWQMAGLGLRLALEAGVHRRKRPGSGCVLEAEMWKRAFWTLVLLDRSGSASLGRPCAIWEEDIDLDLPLEVDDEYLSKTEFKQPPGKPSLMAYFNSSVKLSQILIGALRTIYPVSKSKSVFRLVGPTWEQDMVAALDSSLNNWIDNIPDHLRWDPTPNTTDDFTFYQSALLHSSYNYVQIVVHRPYITPSRRSSPLNLAFPSLAICTNAARACSHILDACLKRGTMLVPMLNHYAFTAAIVLLFNVWGANKPGTGVRVDWEKQVQDVHICMRFIKRSLGRWQHATKLGNMLRDLVFVGDFPLPGASPPTCPGTGAQKRNRDSEGTPDLDTGLDTAATSPSSAEYAGLHPSHNYTHGRDYPPNDCHTSDSDHPHSSSHGQSQNSDHPMTGAGFNEGAESESLAFKQHQAASNSYTVEPSSRLDLGDLSFKLPDLQQQHTSMQQVQNSSHTFSFDPQGNVIQGLDPQNVDGHTAGDVLSALDAAYLGNGSSGIVADATQHTFDVWGSAPSGFQWDEWQQFTNVVQNAPPEAETTTEAVTEAGIGTAGTGFAGQPFVWTPY